MRLNLLALLVAAAFSRASPTLPPVRPLVVWHGLGDSYASPAMQRFMDEVREAHSGIFIHSIHIDENDDKDRKAGWFGNLQDQLPLVAAQIAAVPQLSHGFDAIGFSQGGQFLRAYVEWYNTPPVHNLITFGSQHMGVSDLPGCTKGDIWCSLARSAARAGVYTTYAQHNLIQAQYFRDPKQLPLYLSQNTFLTSINNEVADSRNKTYAKHFGSLNRLVLVLFTQEKTVVPKESSWFGSLEVSEKDGREIVIVPMRLQPLYVEDRIGLRTLDEVGKVKLMTCEGQHMQISTECLAPILQKYVGGTWKERGELVIQGGFN